MIFKITSAGNNSTFGDVFFSAPTKEEMQKAEKRVAEICHEKALNIYKDNPNVFENEIFARIEKEIEKMTDIDAQNHIKKLYNRMGFVYNKYKLYRYKGEYFFWRTLRFLGSCRR